MRTVHEVSRLSGVSIRTLQYYDKIGLLPPSRRTEAGYRLYDDAALRRLQQILLFRALEFPLKDIRTILDRPDFDEALALEQQITLLRLKREQLDRMIDLARSIQVLGGSTMDFSAFDTTRVDAYAAQAKAAWGETPAYREFARRTAGQTPEARQGVQVQLMAIFAEFGQLRREPPEAPAAQALVTRLQRFIGDHFYACTDETLAGLGQMYAAGGAFTANIDRAGGEGTAEFVHRAIQCHSAN